MKVLICIIIFTILLIFVGTNCCITTYEGNLIEKGVTIHSEVITLQNVYVDTDGTTRELGGQYDPRLP